MQIQEIQGQAVNNYGFSNSNARNTIIRNQENKDIFEKFTNWYNDTECSDDNNDGKLKITEFASEYAKGALCGLADTAIEHPVMTGLTIAGTAAATILTGGAIMPIFVAAGILGSGMAIGKGIYDYAAADTDGAAKQAARQTGTGTTGMLLSLFGTKSALKSASTAGVESAAGSESMNMLKAAVQCFKSVPEAAKVSTANVKGNIVTTATGVVQKGSNKLQGGKQGISKASSADVKKIDLSGSQEEILAKYSDAGIFAGEDGNYYIPNKWNEAEPYLVSDNSVLMKYDSDDFAVCAKSVFEKSYGTTESYNSGTFEYSTVDSLSSDSYINATKQAKAKCVTLPEGTKVQTLEGERTVGAADTVAIDVEGNPYVQPATKFESKNIISDEILSPNDLVRDSAFNSTLNTLTESEIEDILE